MRARGRSLLLSPFDSLIWFRDRLERLFGVRHRLEAYTPAAKRQHGYFAMPVLGGNRIVGLVDPARRDGALVAKQVTVLDVRGSTTSRCAPSRPRPGSARPMSASNGSRQPRPSGPNPSRRRLVETSVSPVREFRSRAGGYSLEGFDVAFVGTGLVGVVEHDLVEPELGVRCGELVELFC